MTYNALMNSLYLSRAEENGKIIFKVSILTLIVNIVLTVLKAVFGAIFFNVSVLSDAIHSFSDVGTTVLVLISVLISKPQTDKEHPYGHEKIEPLITLLFAEFLAGTGIFLAVGGIKGIISPVKAELNFYLIAVTVFSIVAKEAMYWYTIHYAKKTNSQTLKADAWHHRSDSLSSLAVLIGLVISKFIGSNLAESIAVVLVAALIIKVAVQIFITSINRLIDKSADDATTEKIRTLVKETEGVIEIDSLQTRLFGNALLVDIEIAVDESLPLKSSHKIAHAVHDKLEAESDLSIKHCNVHVNPVTDGEALGVESE